jgi:hypothetical protein
MRDRLNVQTLFILSPDPDPDPHQCQQDLNVNLALSGDSDLAFGERLY